MCDTCGCGLESGPLRVGGEHAPGRPRPETVTVMQGLLAQNDREAIHNRAHFDHHGILAVNLMSSPGAGKTALLESTIEALHGEFGIAVVEGDLETDNDAERIRRHGVDAVQICTGTTCHLDAAMVHQALHQLDLRGIDLLFIENVGNLVCPASFDLGQHRNVTLLSIPEGDDKPAKYPVIFRAADIVVVTKSDLAPLMPEFAMENVRENVQALASAAPLVALSAKTGAGMAAWTRWLRGEINAQRQRLRSGESARPRVQTAGAASHAAAGE